LLGAFPALRVLRADAPGAARGRASDRRRRARGVPRHHRAQARGAGCAGGRSGLRFLALLLAAGCASPDRSLSDWEREPAQREGAARPAAEESVALPAYPAPASLVEFTVDDPGGFRY